jgi:hypothetical protein
MFYQQVKKTNDSTRFLLPLLSLNIADLKRYNLISVYLDDIENETKYNNCLYLLYEPSDIDIDEGYFRKYLESFHSNELFVRSYPVAEKNRFMLVFRIPHKFTSLIESFKQGRFSDFNKEEILKHFPMHIKLNGEVVVNEKWKIITKYPKLKEEIEKDLNVTLDNDTELYNIPDYKIEVYNPNNKPIETIENNINV